MNDFVFSNSTKVYFGKDQMHHLPEEVGRFGNRVLVVYGGGSVKRNGTYDAVMNPLHEAGIQTFELAGVEPNPRHTTVNRGAQICRDNDIDVVLAIGGGSAIDCSKAIAATTLADTDDVWDLVERKVPYTEALPIMVVLTMAATGSEMDSSAVISNMEKNVKSGIAGEMVRPTVTFENPEFSFTVPAYQTACGSVDIMDHVLDTAYLNSRGQMDMLNRMQEQLVATVVKWAPVALAEPTNYDARANLMWASSWALNGFISQHLGQDAVVHAMEHELSAYYDLTHGHGIAILLPRWLEYILSDATAPTIARLGIACFGVDASLDTMDAAKATIEAISTFCFTTLGLKSTLTEMGIGEENFEVMAKAACKGRTLHGITDITPEDVVNIYRMCL